MSGSWKILTAYSPGKNGARDVLPTFFLEPFLVVFVHGTDKLQLTHAQDCLSHMHAFSVHHGGTSTVLSGKLRVTSKMPHSVKPIGKYTIS